MALRSLDNALPIKSERPKKASTNVNSPAAICNPSLNDENTAPTPPKAPEQSVEYIASEDLKAFTDPETKIKNLLMELESKDWIKVCGALNDVRQLALYHFSLLLPILENVMSVMVKAIKNPRSALCKTAIMASGDIFTSAGHTLFSTSEESTAINNLLLQLLFKASQDKRFVCEEAEKALEKMAAFMSPLPLLKKLHTYVNHANLRVRAKAAVAISKCLAKTDIEVKREFGLATLIQIGAELLNDRLPEAREAARSIISSIHSGFMEEEEENDEDDDDDRNEEKDGEVMMITKEEAWQSFCSSNLPPISAQSVVKLVSPH